MRPLLHVFIVAELIALLVGFQFGVLEQTPEYQEETQFVTLGREIPAGRALMTYLSLTFTGSFRSMAADFLWLKYERSKDQHRMLEAHQFAQILLVLQPKNPAVWEALAHDYTHNIPAVVPKHERFDLIRRGYLLLAEGNRQIPNSAALHQEMGFKLVQKVSWNKPIVDDELCSQIEQDSELQKELVPTDTPRYPRPPGAVGGRSPFELAIPWMQRASRLAVEEEARRGKTVYTQMGLLVHPMNIEGNIWHAQYLQAMYEWRRRRYAEALWWIDRTIEQNVELNRRFPNPIYFERLEMVRRMIPLINLHQRGREATDPAERMAARSAFVSEGMTLLMEFETLDDGFVRRELEELRRNAVRQTFGEHEALIREGGEIDDFNFAANYLRPGSRRRWIYPSDSDQDLYYLAGQHSDREEEAPPTRRVQLTLKNLSDRFRLHLRMVGPKRAELLEIADAIVPPGESYKFDGQIETEQHVVIYISALDGTATDPAEYELELEP